MKFKRGFLLIASLLTCLTALSASGQQTTQQSPAAQPTAHSNSAGSTRPALQRREWRYLLRPSDVIAVHFSITEVFNQQVAVQPDGFKIGRASCRERVYVLV